MSDQWRLAPGRPQMQLDYGQVSCGCAEFQALIDDFTWTARLDFFQTLVSNELVENSPEGWRPLRDVSLATIELQ